MRASLVHTARRTLFLLALALTSLGARALHAQTDVIRGKVTTLEGLPLPGVRVTARHSVAATVGGACVTLSICYEGIFGGWLARWTGDLNERYLALEADGLKRRCAELATKPQYHEVH